MKRIAIGLILVGIFFASIIALPFVLTSSKSHRMKRLTWLPQTANVLYFEDNHGGFHGDGLTFVTFTCPDTDQPWNWSPEKWINPPLDLRARKTFDTVIRDFSIPPEQLPDLKSSSVYYLIDDSSDRRDAYTGHLYIQDKEKNQYWYFNITT